MLLARIVLPCLLLAADSVRLDGTDSTVSSLVHRVVTANQNQLDRRVAAYGNSTLAGRFRLQRLLRSDQPGEAFPALKGFKDGRHLGQGSFGDTWSAFDEKLQKEVAVKIFYMGDKYISRQNAGPEARYNLQEASQQCQDILQLVKMAESRPEPEKDWVQYLCPCLEDHVASSADTGEPAFLVYEMCGESLWNEVVEPGSKADPASFGAEHAKMVRVFMQGFVRGIGYLNSFDPPFIHHDLKPENVCVNQEKQARIIDFDAVIQADPEGHPDSVVSTAPYAAPETYYEDDPAWAGHPWSYDMYAAGLIWAETLCPAVNVDDWWNEDDGPVVWNPKETVLGKCTALKGEVPDIEEDLAVITEMVSHDFNSRPDPKTVNAKLEKLLAGR